MMTAFVKSDIRETHKMYLRFLTVVWELVLFSGGGGWGGGVGRLVN